MVDVYRALARVQAPSGAVAATGTARTPGTGTEPGAWWATVDTDEELPEALFPRTSRQQYVGLRIRIGGETLDPRFLLGGITVQQKVEGFAVFRFAVVLEVESERWPLGDPWALRAPAPGLAPVDIDGLYATSSGVFAYRLLTNGLVNETSIEDVGGAEGLVVRGLGPGARYQRRRVSLHLPPDHRTPRGVVVRRLAQLASVVGESIPAGRPMRKELSLDRSAWLETARQLLELEGLHLTWSEDGTLTAVPRLPSGTHEAVITARDLLRLSTRARFRSDVPTEIRLSAEEETLDTEAASPAHRTVAVSPFGPASSNPARNSRSYPGDRPTLCRFRVGLNVGNTPAVHVQRTSAFMPRSVPRKRRPHSRVEVESRQPTQFRVGLVTA